MTDDSQQPDIDEPQESKLTRDIPRIELSVPWGHGLMQSISRPTRLDGKTSYNSENFYGVDNNFITERTRLHEIYIREQAHNKRIGMILSFVLILAAALIITFAPKDREKMSYWVGASLVIFAAGANGFGRVWGKAANISFGADQDERQL